MSPRPAVLLMCLPVLGSCINRWDHPSIREEFARLDEETEVAFFIDAPPRLNRPDAAKVIAEILKESLSSYVITPSPLEKGTQVFVEVLHRYEEPSSAADLSVLLSVATLFAFPGSRRFDFVVKYDLYLDGQLTKHYRYEITQKNYVWLGLAPFVWVNILTASEEDALRATAHRFLLDAQRDGYLEAPGAT